MSITATEALQRIRQRLARPSRHADSYVSVPRHWLKALVDDGPPAAAAAKPKRAPRKRQTPAAVDPEPSPTEEPTPETDE